MPHERDANNVVLDGTVVYVNIKLDGTVMYTEMT